MAKSPRKSASLPQTKLTSKSYSRTKNNNTAKKSNFAGKATKYYHANKSNRRFSIVDSSSSDSEKTFNNKYSHSSDSESSLTAVSEDETSSALKNNKKLYKSKKSLKSNKINLGRKHVPKKSVKRNHNWNQVEKEEEDDDEEEEEEKEEDDEEEDDDEDEDKDDDAIDSDSPGDLGLEGLYSLMNTSRQSDESASDDDDEDEDAVSSSDDDVDFVQLQAERKAARVALKSTQRDKPNQNKSRTNSISKPKFGRRKSNVTLPEDINFTFDFDDLNNEDVIVDDFEQVSKTFDVNDDSMDIDNEEDVGEEITPTNDPIDITKDQFNVDFDFDTPMIPVPKIRDEDLNSDDEYEFDDNELLATLHAENDLDEFIDDDYIKQSRNNSMGSIGEDDPFLKEEEKFLVNEFESNGFDDELEDFSTSDKQLMDSFNDNDQNKKPVVQYESSLASESGGYEDEDEDEFDDFVDFDVPIFDDNNIEETNLSDDQSEMGVGQYFKKPSNQNNNSKKSKKNSKKRLQNAVINSDEEDDSYLWNYFFSSGESEDENNVERYNDASEDEDLDVDQLFADMNNKNRRLSQASTKKALTLTSNIIDNDSFDSEDGYESGDSTDEDLNLPKSSNKSKLPSKKAKEVLSSKTADYRPPILGTWVAVDSKPFGIIDGLSTRTLVSSNNINKGMEPRKGRKSIIPPNDDSALGLDELLNISELDDDDENDIRIWRDFNNQKKQVPLGAFRNKSSQSSLIYPHNSQSKEFTNNGFGLSYSRNNSISRGVVKKTNTTRRNSINSKPASEASGLRNAKSKQRRKSSIAEAVSEGFRPTKSGLFSENALADIEEVLGDDNEFLALIKGI